MTNAYDTYKAAMSAADADLWAAKAAHRAATLAACIKYDSDYIAYDLAYQTEMDARVKELS